jgi:hypothetical protein
MSTFQERMTALLSSNRLPALDVDLALYRRLRAMQERLIDEDPTLADCEPDRGFEHVLYAALCAGVRASEAEAGVSYDENTGLKIEETR